MSQPPTYNRQFSFTNYQTVNPSLPLPAVSLDTELNAVKQTLDATLANLKRIQRDDGAIKNASIGLDQLSPAVTVGFSVPTAWATGTGYVPSPAATAFNGGKFYSCLVSHTSGTFATDLAAGKWALIADLTAIPLVAANQIAVTPSGNLTTDVQTSLAALDSAKAATSHTHPSSAISDSTADGRAFLSATLAAQKVLLGLGSLAFLNAIPVTAIGAQLAFTGVISPAALVASTNDWTPTSWATSAVAYLSATSSINITGLVATTDGDVKLLHNNGTFPVTFTANDAASAAANRIVSSGPTVVPPNGDIVLQYDGTSATKGWRKLSPTSTHQRFDARLTKSAANLALNRFRGAHLFINGANELIPAAGITLAPPATTTTLYYIYAYMSSGVMTLEASATAYATQADYGHAIKTGDATRTLVGMAYTLSSAWVDSATQRYVRSYYNDPGISTLNSFSADRSTTSTTYAEINSEIRNEFLVWTGEVVGLSANGHAFNVGSTGFVAQSSIGIDGATAEDTYCSTYAGTGTTPGPVSLGLYKSGLAEGYHYATLLGKVASSTGTWAGSGTAGTRSTLRAFAKL